ncbi:DUF397 domain-containing protein [Streptomyces sp. NPDC091281]|uniref:DUF397 domain-containing protein n=1 Tax=Streptomyces sp. NPDC091281 TaxID=3365985 RepID=UPI00381AB20E
MDSRWRKSSYSGDQGGDCVECAPLGILTWTKSSYSSDQGGECVEVAGTPCDAVAVRDSKVPAGARLALAPAVFSAFVNWAGTSLMTFPASDGGPS